MKKILLTILIIGCCTISSTSFADEIITEIATPVEVTEVNANTTETEINTEPNQTIEEAKILILEDDPEMVEMAKEEMKEAEGKLDTLEEVGILELEDREEENYYQTKSMEIIE